mmetsp:Transcript_89427/g.278289  ORF Transcript_89427/g.278289 Transcript_89427/m.278289 type:complete len:230 (+) Transcript_89427:1622-2311(+)
MACSRVSQRRKLTDSSPKTSREPTSQSQTASRHLSEFPRAPMTCSMRLRDNRVWMSATRVCGPPATGRDCSMRWRSLESMRLQMSTTRSAGPSLARTHSKSSSLCSSLSMWYSSRISSFWPFLLCVEMVRCSTSASAVVTRMSEEPSNSWMSYCISPSSRPRRALMWWVLPAPGAETRSTRQGSGEKRWCSSSDRKSEEKCEGPGARAKRLSWPASSASAGASSLLKNW